MNDKKVLYLVIPCLNEEEVLPVSAQRLTAKMQDLIAQNIIAPDSKVMFVDDGSKDQTWSLIEELQAGNSLFCGVKLAHNRGQTNALVAGLSEAYPRADVTITLDVDLQDDINVIEQMMAEYAKGAEIVYGVRSSRKKDSFFKRFTAEAYYKMMLKLGVEVIYNHSECRLMSKKAVGALLQYAESNLFLKALVPQIGLPSATVQYQREKRIAGKTKYSVKKMVALAVDGITSFSIKPLTTIWWLGFWSVLGGGVAFITTIILLLVKYINIVWPILSALWFGLGIILLAIGTVGVYVGKIYIESKHRPRFFIEKRVG